MSNFNPQNSNARQRTMIDYTNKDYASLREAMLNLAREKLPEWTDQSPTDPGVVLLELVAYMGDILLYYQDRLANESYLDTAVERRSVMNLLRLIGYELRPVRSASADLTLLFKVGATGRITIETDTEFKTTTQPSGITISFRYVHNPLTIDLDSLDLISLEGSQYKLLERLPVTQVDAVIQGETIGSADGSVGQRFRLARSPLIDNSLEIRVDGKLWIAQKTLLYSYSDSLHYLIRRDEQDVVWIEFGDGKFGRIPARGDNNITAAYRVGGGIKGNVLPNSISGAVTAIGNSNDQKPQKVFNLAAATGGAEREEITEAIFRGPQLFRARSRAVTAEDYEAFAREYGVGKVRAHAPGWNVVELYVAPIGGGWPSDTLKEDLRLYFEDKRMLTSIVEVKDPTYVPVSIEGDLFIDRTYLKEQVQQRVRDVVNQLLAFENVDFADRLFISKVYEVIEAVEGVSGVNITKFTRDGLAQDDLPKSGMLNFDANEIPEAKYPTGIILNQVIQGGRGAG